VWRDVCGGMGVQGGGVVAGRWQTKPCQLG